MENQILNILFLFLAFYLCINISLCKKVKSTYNFGDEQNYEIDLLYKHQLGQNLYFIDKNERNQTIYSLTMYPNLALQIKMKFYTNNKKIIDALDSGKIIYLGIDLNISNTDITLENYTTDIIVCGFTKKDTNCYDYVYDKINLKYIRNENGEISKNNLIPLNFEQVELNILQENVISYSNYYRISFEKNYSEYFDKVTMFNWINYVACDLEQVVSGFYGIVNSDDEWTNIKKNDNSTIYYGSLTFGDGAGIKNSCYYIKLSIYYYFYILSLFILLF